MFNNPNNKPEVTLDMITDRIVHILSLFLDCNISTLHQLVVESEAEDRDDGHDGAGIALQEFIGDNLKKEFRYATGYAIMCTAFEIAGSGLDNANEILVTDRSH